MTRWRSLRRRGRDRRTGANVRVSRIIRDLGPKLRSDSERREKAERKIFGKKATVEEQRRPAVPPQARFSTSPCSRANRYFPRRWIPPDDPRTSLSCPAGLGPAARPGGLRRATAVNSAPHPSPGSASADRGAAALSPCSSTSLSAPYRRGTLFPARDARGAAALGSIAPP